MKKKIVIVGAGITGLTTAYKLLECGYDVTVVERDEAVGGLSRTYRDGEFLFDSGPHKIYTKNQKIIEFLGTILKRDLLPIEMTSGVYILNQYYDWPLTMRVIFKFPINKMLSAGIDMLKLILKKIKQYSHIRTGGTLDY